MEPEDLMKQLKDDDLYGELREIKNEVDFLVYQKESEIRYDSKNIAANLFPYLSLCIFALGQTKTMNSITLAHSIINKIYGLDSTLFKESFMASLLFEPYIVQYKTGDKGDYYEEQRKEMLCETALLFYKSNRMVFGRYAEKVQNELTSYFAPYVKVYLQERAVYLQKEAHEAFRKKGINKFYTTIGIVFYIPILFLVAVGAYEFVDYVERWGKWAEIIVVILFFASLLVFSVWDMVLLAIDKIREYDWQPACVVTSVASIPIIIVFYSEGISTFSLINSISTAFRQFFNWYQYVLLIATVTVVYSLRFYRTSRSGTHGNGGSQEIPDIPFVKSVLLAPVIEEITFRYIPFVVLFSTITTIPRQPSFISQSFLGDLLNINILSYSISIHTCSFLVLIFTTILFYAAHARSRGVHHGFFGLFLGYSMYLNSDLFTVITMHMIWNFSVFVIDRIGSYYKNILREPSDVA